MNSFKRNLILGYSISLVLLIVSAGASYISIRNLLKSQLWVNHTNEVILRLEQVISVLKDAETGGRGFLLTGQSEFLEPYNGALERADALIENVKNLTIDNPAQQQSILLLRNIASKRIWHIQDLVEDKKTGHNPSLESLRSGKHYMDQAREIVTLMQNREQALLTNRSETVDRFSSWTPIFILIASLLSIIVTIISFLRVKKDFENREFLQSELIKKDEIITSRLNIIKDVAEKISGGNYKIRLDDEVKDVLGTLSVSLNKMAISLDKAFQELSDKEWYQTGVAKLNEIMIGEKELETLSFNVINFIGEYTHSQIGAFYVVKNIDTLALSGSVGLTSNGQKLEIKKGDGIAGQSFLSGKEVYIQGIEETDVVINYSAGALKPRSIIAVPIFYDNQVKGVIELGTINAYTPIIHDFLKAATFNIGIAVQSTQDQRKVHELLSETQVQSEELQSQHTELENINSELEAQSEKLQASEEELRVQQEELQQANQELEERSSLLEEKNELILKRNLDIQKKAEELEQSTKYKSEFLANMSHELRTPLNSILLLSRLLSENHGGNLNSDEIEYATVIQTSGTGLLTLIDEILDLSKIESGKMDLDFTDVKIEEVATQIQSLFGPLAKEKGLQLNIVINPLTTQIIETDRLRLEQIIRNLISNALKFTKKGSVTLKIEKENDTVVFAVVDTGIGIAADKIQTVFEAFKQADGSTSRQYGGTGLGLSISRELAKLLGGEIKLKSEVGKGSEFILMLPEKKVVTKPQPEILHRETFVEQRREVNISNDEHTYRSQIIPASLPDDRDVIKNGDKVILIIEDDVAFAKSLLEYTRKKGYKGIVAVRGDEALELADKFMPTGILLDVQLPVKSGWEVMDELKGNSRTRPIPVHMMSSVEAKTKSISKGAVDFINKPVAFEKLGDVFEKIEQALAKSPKKVLIVEENPKHAMALANFLERYNVIAEIRNSVKEGITALNENLADCIILDMGIPAQGSYDVLEDVKKTPGLENIPIIVFTGKNLSNIEEMRIKKYADSIVVKTAHSYERILDEVSLFLHIVEENRKTEKNSKYKKMGKLDEVLKGKVILVADDDVRNIFSITKSLEKHEVIVISAIDGKEALKQLQENEKIDLVLMDMMMPEMDGYESTRQIRQIPKYRNLPIIAVTAKAMMGDREKCIDAGASDYITKPVDIDQLISLLRVWLYE